MIIIEPEGGLCNYLRVIFSYYKYANSLNTELSVVWNETSHCNGHFLNYFQPVPNMHFIKNNVSNNIKIDYKGCSVHPKYKPDYTCLKLLPDMQEKIDKRKSLLGDKYISVHIRRTDHIVNAKKNNVYTTDDEFMQFIEENLKDSISLYVATDNVNTYNLYKHKYENALKCNYHKTLNSFRKTSLHDAIIDLYVCMHSTYFKGSRWSSFSDLIEQLRNRYTFVKANIIVVHYNNHQYLEMLEQMKGLNYPYVVNIFNKSNNKISINEKYKVHNIENEGREGMTYLNYIIKNYDNLNEYTIFIQDDTHNHIPSYNDFVAFCQNTINNNVLFKSYPCSWRQNFEPVKRVIKNGIFDLHTFPSKDSIQKCCKINDIHLPETYITETCSFFICHKKSILKRNKGFYINLKLWLAGDIKNEFVLEHIWEIIFN